MNKKMTIIICAILVLFGAVTVTTNLMNKRVSLTKNEITVEAGDTLKVSVEDLFKGKEESLKAIKLDTSSVNTNTVGDYQITATYGKKTFNIAVKVVDTKAPSVEITNRVIFTNDTTKTLKWQDFANIYDVTGGIICKIESFSRVNDLMMISDAEMVTLKTNIESTWTMTQDEIREYLNLETTSKTAPTEEGIYYSVLSFTDACGNTSYEQVVVVYDTTFANVAFDNTVAISVTVGEDDFKNPENIDLLRYTLIDNVDGTIDCDEYAYEFNPIDSDNGIWELIITYVDRAGNECTHEVLVNLTLDKNIVESGGSTDNSNNNNNNNGNNNSGNTGNNNNGGNSNNGGSTDSGNSGPVSGGYDNLDIWDTNGDGYVSDIEKSDTNHDGIIDGDEAWNYISPFEQYAMDWTAQYGCYKPFTFVHPETFEVTYGIVLPSDKHVDVYTIDPDPNSTSPVGWVPNWDGSFNEAYQFDPSFEGLMDIEAWEAYTGQTYTGARYIPYDNIIDAYLAEIGLRRAGGTAMKLPDGTEVWYYEAARGDVKPLP